MHAFYHTLQEGASDDIAGPPVNHYDVQIITPGSQVGGQLETVGPVFNFINDPRHQSFSLLDARLTPLTPGTPLQVVVRAQVTLRKPRIVLLHFTSAEARASIRPLVRRELLVAHTPLAVCRGGFHMSAESSVHEFLDITPGDLLPVTEADIFPLINLPHPFPAENDMLLIGRDFIQLYHPA